MASNKGAAASKRVTGTTRKPAVASATRVRSRSSARGSTTRTVSCSVFASCLSATAAPVRQPEPFSASFLRRHPQDLQSHPFPPIRGPCHPPVFPRGEKKLASRGPRSQQQTCHQVSAGGNAPPRLPPDGA